MLEEAGNTILECPKENENNQSDKAEYVMQQRHFDEEDLQDVISGGNMEA